MKWTTDLKMDEMWLNSDREILGRMRQGQGKAGILVTLSLPNGEDFQAEVEKMNATAASLFCNMAREYFNEWKAGKEAASSSKHRDRQQQGVLGKPGGDTGVQPASGVLSVPETVAALEAPVSGGTSLEEDILRRLDEAYVTRSRLREQREEIDRTVVTVEESIVQMEQMKEIFNASKVLEEASRSVRGANDQGQAPGQGVDNQAHSPPSEPDGSEGLEQARKDLNNLGGTTPPTDAVDSQED